MTDEEFNKIFNDIIQRLEKMNEAREADNATFDKRVNYLEQAFVNVYNTLSETSKQIQENSEQIRENSKQIQEHTKQIRLQFQALKSLGAFINKQSKQICSLGLSVEKLREDGEKMREDLQKQNERSEKINERLDNFIALLERYLSQNGNGSTENKN